MTARKPVLGAAIDSGADLRIDLARLVATRLLLQANSGGGKSWALRRILEQTHGLVQHIVLDVEDEFFTLRERFDYVLAGREGGDCPADVRSAPLLARRLLELNVSAIIGLYELKAQERVRFVRLFLESLISAPRSLWHPAIVVVDEAHMYCPEKEEAESAGAVIDLMTRGRKRGFCGVLATQRISKLAKDAAAEANNKLIGRAALDVDMKRAGLELGFSGREQLLELRALEAGEFFAFGPALSPQVVKVKVGPVETTHPEAGKRSMIAPAEPTDKVRATLAKLADLPKEAAQEAQDLATLRREVTELRRQLKQTAAAPDAKAREQVTALKESMKGALAAMKADIQRAHDHGRFEGVAEGLRRAAEHIKPLVSALNLLAPASGGLAALLAELREIKGAMPLFLDRAVSDPNAEAFASLKLFNEALSKSGVGPTPSSRGASHGRAVPSSASRAQTPGPAPSRPRGNGASEPDEGVTRPMQRVLDALAWLEAAAIAPASREQVAVMAGMSPTSSHFTNQLGALRGAGMIEYPAGGAVALTDAGRGAARAPEAAPSTEELHAKAREILSRPAWRVLAPLLDAYPNELEREQLAELAGMSATSSHFTNQLGALRGIGFVDYPQGGAVVATRILFVN